MQKENLKKRTDTSKKKRKKLALGRGLDALIPDLESEAEKPQEYFQCDISQITHNRYQPRQHFSDDDLEELTASIKTQGIIQPLLVRKNDGGYELVAGERRLRAPAVAWHRDEARSERLAFRRCDRRISPWSSGKAPCRKGGGPSGPCG